MALNPDRGLSFCATAIPFIRNDNRSDNNRGMVGNMGFMTIGNTAVALIGNVFL